MAQLDSLGNNIRNLRLAHGWSQTELAKKVGVSAAYIGMLERSEKEPKLSTLVRIANTLGSGVDSLLDHELISQQAVICSNYVQAISALPVSIRQAAFAILDALIKTQHSQINR